MAQTKKDPVDMTFKEHFQSEIAKMKPMTWGERITYFWDYYKVLLVILAFIILAIVIGVEIFQNSKNTEVFYMGMLNSSTMDNQEEELEEAFREFAGITSERETITIDSTMYFNLEFDDTNTVNSNMKLVTLFAANQLDVLIGPEEVVEENGQKGMLADLTTTLSDELYQKLEPYFLETKLTETGETFVYGISVDEFDALSACYSSEGTVLGIAGNVSHLDMTFTFLEFLLQ